MPPRIIPRETGLITRTCGTNLAFSVHRRLFPFSFILVWIYHSFLFTFDHYPLLFLPLIKRLTRICKKGKPSEAYIDLNDE